MAADNSHQASNCQASNCQTSNCQTSRATPEVAVWAHAEAQLAAGKPVALAALVARTGSGPGRVGAMLALSETSPAVGTVGGGPPESQIIKACREMLAAPTPPTLVMLDHRRGVPEASGLSCGGTSTYAIWHLTPDHCCVVSDLVADLRRGRNRLWNLGVDGWKVSTVGDQGATDGFAIGPRWQFTHTAGPRGQVLLVGGGHVNLALSQLLVSCGFGVTVIDERPQLQTMQDNEAAHDLIVGRYEELESVLAQHPAQIAIVATHDPDGDRRAMATLLPIPLKYLGLLGSRAKVAAILGRPPYPGHVHAPAGMQIGSQTPEEIAVSITAELIALRSQNAFSRSERSH